MKKLLYAYLSLQVFAAVINLLSTLQISAILAVIIFIISLIGVILPIAIIKNLDNIEEIQSEIFRLRQNLRQMERALNGEDIEDQTVVASTNAEVAGGVWKCIKCGSINKEGTSYCANCKAAYCFENNPTDDPNKKKKLNRWGI